MPIVKSETEAAVNSALAAKIQNAQIANIRADTMKKDAETILTKNADQKMDYEKLNLMQQYQNMQAQFPLIMYNSESAKAISEIKRSLEKGMRTEGKIDESTYGEILRWLGRLNPFSSSAKNIAPLIKE